MCCCGTFRPTSVSVPVVIPDVLDIMAASEIVAGWDAADLAASPVALWPDASGNGFDLAQAVGASQPTWTAAGGANGQPSVLFDGSDDFMANAALNLPAPGTTPSFYWVVLRQVTWNGPGFGTLTETTTSGLGIYQGGISPELIQYNTADSNNTNGLTLNVYKRLVAFWNNAISDYIQAGSVVGTGVNSGNKDPGAGFYLGSGIGGAFPGNFEVCEFWIFNVEPSPAQKTLLDAYASNRYGASVLT